MSEAIIPQHLGLILDGNRRWAKAAGKPAMMGHDAGYKNFQKISEAAFDRGVPVVSAYIFSTENWERDEAEVDHIMNLALRMFKRDVKRLYKKGIKVVWLGTPDRLKPALVKAIAEAEKHTEHNHKGTLAICLNYGGQAEIVEATKRIIRRGIDAAKVTVKMMEDEMYHSELPPVDMIVRTSGEQRISNFMLWRSAYAELYFSEKNWPDFSEADLDLALASYSSRSRRIGK
jgi:undecaprenyl diphosphate synthase